MATAEKAATKPGPADVKVEQPKNDPAKAKPSDQNVDKKRKNEKKPSGRKEPQEREHQAVLHEDAPRY